MLRIVSFVFRTTVSSTSKIIRLVVKNTQIISMSGVWKSCFKDGYILLSVPSNTDSYLRRCAKHADIDMCKEQIMTWQNNVIYMMRQLNLKCYFWCIEVTESYQITESYQAICCHAQRSSWKSYKKGIPVLFLKQISYFNLNIFKIVVRFTFFKE